MSDSDYDRGFATWECPDCGRSYLDTGWRWLEQEKVTTP